MRSGTRLCAAALAWLAASPVGGAKLLEGLEDPSAWSALTAPGAAASVHGDAGVSGRALRLDFELHESRGFVVIRRPLRLRLPPNWAISFRIRSNAPANDLEVKFVDPSGENVWWRRLRDFRFPRDWERVVVRKSQLQFAWGPAKGGDIEELAAIEIAVVAGRGGRGSLWIDELRIDEREAVADLASLRPRVKSSSALEGFDPGAAFDGDPATSWRSKPGNDPQSLTLDFGRRVEYGGLVIEWDGDDGASAYRVLASNDARAWTMLYEATAAGGARSFVPLPDGESRWLRLELQRSRRGAGFAIREIALGPVAFGDSHNAFFSAVARDSARGLWPKHLLGEQTYWTVVGVDRAPQEGLLNEEGMLEVDRERFSIEPFLHVDGRLVTWADAEPTQELERGYLPIPTVVWRWRGLALRVTAFAAGPPHASTLYARYRLHNTGKERRTATLFLALRPFQVNPPWQSLNQQGGFASVERMARRDQSIYVNADKIVRSLTRLDGFGAAAFESGPLTDWLARGALPPSLEVADLRGAVSGALRYPLEVPAGESRDVWIAVPFAPAALSAQADEDEKAAAARLDETVRAWEERLARIVVRLPPRAEEIVHTLKSTVAWILIHRDGAAIMPGSRDYARSWIRDGALTSAALLELGYTDEVRDFLRWYAGYQAEDGRIPCCVDERGADPTLEHDSNGEFIYALTDYYRYTRDKAFLAEMWSRVVRGVAHIRALREQTLAHDGELPVQGLAPASISHEGYSAFPVHSYWDDFFLLRGLKDAVVIARELGDERHAEEFAALRDEFRASLYRSIDGAVARHQIDFIPGSVELGDFDPTSTSIAVSPVGELENLPQPALARTFERYFEHFMERRSGAIEWQAYTPYELRNVGTLVRLGRKDLAHEALEFFLGDRRPRAWNGWGEVVFRDPQHPGFIGDMPHGWVGAGFIRSLRSFFVYENELDDSLVLGAGLPRAWVESESGVEVELPTWHGRIHFTARGEARRVRIRIEGDLAQPPSKIVVASPYAEPLAAVTVNGRRVSDFTAAGVTLAALPADIVFSY